MSFILDALKKSESERQQKSAPGIADVPDSSGPAAAPRWTWILVALLIINVVVVLGLWLRPAAERDPPAQSAIEVEPQGIPSFSRLVSEARDSAPPPRASAAEQPPRTVAPAQEVAAVGPQSTPAAVPPATSTDADAVPAQLLRTFNELRANGSLQLPDLHLDIHVYGDKPADRFVFVNMNKYRERGKLDEGPIIKEISVDGVILEHQGTEFLLPRE